LSQGTMGAETPQRTRVPARRLSTTTTPSEAPMASGSKIRRPSISGLAATTPKPTESTGSTPSTGMTRRLSSVMDSGHPAQAPRTRRLSSGRPMDDQESSMISRPSSTPARPGGRRHSTASIDMNVSSMLTLSRATELGDTPHLPRYMAGTAASKAGTTPGKTAKPMASRLPTPIRVTKIERRSVAGETPVSSALASGAASVGSIASLNDLSFSSGRCGPVKRTAAVTVEESIETELDETDVLVLPKRRRFDSTAEAAPVFALRTIKELSEEEKVLQFERELIQFNDKYEREIRPILERRQAEITAAMPQPTMDKDSSSPPVEVLSTSIHEAVEGEEDEVAPIDENAVKNTPRSGKAVNVNAATPRPHAALHALMNKHPCIRDAVANYKSRTQSES
ncbi:hypothetical protein PFISCL1PPCAC_16176, partial [Pristionchus fissidentatus]